MPNYQNGLIYKLCCKDTNITDIYIGSTTSFRHRKSNHKSDCNNEKHNNYNCNVYKFIRENGGWENWNMVLVEYYKCDSKLELEKREREVIENLKSSLNQVIPRRTIKEYYQDNKEKYKEYYEDNKKQILEKKKEYYEDNMEKIKEISKKYQQDNKEKTKETRKKYYEKNKEKILEINKKYYEKNKITCECGAIISKPHFNRHTKSIKHQGFIVLKNNIHNI